MDRVRRLDQLWGWLPAFRAAAESEHLPTAAKWLCVTPSAISRSIRLLEEELGQPLFDRVGRRLKLNAEGVRLLRAIRLGMRSLDDAVVELTGQAIRGPIRVAAPVPVQARIVLPCLGRLLARHPELEPNLRAVKDVDIATELLTGSLDLAIMEAGISHPDLQIDTLISLESGLFCGRGHPLYGVESPTLEGILEHSFVVPEGAESVFPLGVSRRVGAHVSYIDWALSLCIQGCYIAVLPMALAEAFLLDGALRLLPMANLGQRTIYSARRIPLRQSTPEGLLLEEIKADIQSQFGN